MQHTITAAPPARTARLAALVVAGLIVLFAAFTSSAQASVYQWTFDFPSHIAPSTNYSFSMYNEIVDDHLVHEDRGENNCSGINLGWNGAKTLQWRFRRQDGSTGPLRYGERLALRNTHNMDYVHYHSRWCGINLGYTNDPDYEWVIKGGTTGAAVTFEAGNELYNLTEEDDLVYAWRPRGVNLRWMDDAEAWYCQYHNYC